MRHHLPRVHRTIRRSVFVTTTAMLMASTSISAVLAADIAGTTNGAAVPGAGDTVQSGVTVSNSTNTGSAALTITSGNTFTNNGTVTSDAGSSQAGIGASGNDNITINNNAGGVIQSLGTGNAIRLDDGNTINNAGTISTTGGAEAVRLDQNTLVNNTGTIQNDTSPAAANNATALRVGSGTVNNGTEMDHDNAKLISNGNATNLSAGNQDSNVYALRAGDNGTVTVNNYGLIQANGDTLSVEQGFDEGEVGGVRLEGASSVLNNYGTIETTGETLVGADTNANSADDGYEIGDMYGVRVDGLNASVHNYAGGTITGGKHGITIDDATSGVTITNDLGGTISGLNGSGVGSDTDGSVTNYGSISGTYNDAYAFGDGDGVDIDLVGSVYNYGSIAGLGSKGTKPGELSPSTSEGIAIGGGTIVNGDISHLSASITGANNGILIDDSNGGDALGSTTITNYGSIEGTDGYGIRMRNLAGTYNLTIDNYGDITGGNGTAVLMGDGDDSFSQLGGTITGTVDAEGGNDSLSFDTGSADTVDGTQFINFEATSILSGFITLENDFTSSSSFDLASGATLAASSTITTATFTNSGTLEPAGVSDIGTLAIDGDFVNEASGVINIDLGEDTADSIEATGAVTLNGGTINIYNTLTPFRSDLTYEVVTGSSLTGTFDTVNDYIGSAFVTADIAYDADSANLSFTRTGATYEQYANPFSASLAAALDNVNDGGTASPDLQAILGYIDTLTPSEAADVFDQMMPDTTGSQTAATTDVMGLFFTGVNARINARQATNQRGSVQVASNGTAGDLTASLVGPSFYGAGSDNGFWARGFGLTGQTDARTGFADGYDYRGAGFQGGYDIALDDASVLGLSAGYARTNIEGDRAGSQANVSSWLLGLYAGTSIGALDLSGQVGASLNAHESGRDALILGTLYRAKSDYDGLTLSGSAEVGYSLEAGSWTVRPVAGLDVFHIHTDSYTETGAPGANLTQAAYDDYLVRSSLGFGLTTQFDAGFLGVLQPSADIRWGHDLDQADATSDWSFAGTPGSAFQVSGNELDRDALLVNLGMQAYAKDALSIGLNASGDFRSNAQGGGLALNMRYSW